MESEIEIFVSSLSKDIPKIERAWLRQKGYWPEASFPMVHVFGELADVILETFQDIGGIERNRIFDQIEKGMTSSNRQLVTAVATGLIESLTVAKRNDEFLWNEVQAALGKESLAHALAWIG